MTRTEELQKIIKDAREELGNIETAENIKKNASLVGEYFKFRNCYSCPATKEDYWWTYMQITSIDDFGNLNGWRFDIDKYGKVTVEKTEDDVIDNWIPITKAQFQKAWDKIRETIFSEFVVV